MIALIQRAKGPSLEGPQVRFMSKVAASTVRLPLNRFKDAATKADEEFTKAYAKGVNLGPESWAEAVSHFSNATKHYSEVGNYAKANEGLGSNRVRGEGRSRDLWEV